LGLAHVGHERLYLGDQVLIEHVGDTDRPALGSKTPPGTLQRQARPRTTIRRHSHITLNGEPFVARQY
jgi:hypothetical protein